MTEHTPVTGRVNPLCDLFFGLFERRNQSLYRIRQIGMTPAHLERLKGLRFLFG
jgi:hypothetical protein